jgi:hypothetical protein
VSLVNVGDPLSAGGEVLVADLTPVGNVIELKTVKAFYNV